MHALVIMQCTNFGGMERATIDQMTHLAKRGWRFRVSTRRPWGASRELFTAFDPHAVAAEYRGRFGWRTHFDFADSLGSHAAGTSVSWVVGTSLGAVRAAAALPTPVVLSHHYHHFEGKLARLRWRGFYELSRGVRAFIYPTEFTKDEAVRIAPWLADRSYVVPYSFERHYVSEEARLRDRRIARKELGIPEDAFVVGNAGWLIRRKRFDVFLRTAAELARRLPTAQFEICGVGSEQQELQKLAQRLGVANRLNFRGLVDDMGVHYRAWDVCLFNSDFDTLPTTPLQAASWGCVVVASLRYGGLGEFLRDRHNGALLSEHNVGRLCDTLMEVASNEQLAAAWRRAADDALLTRHAPDECARMLARILEP